MGQTKTANETNIMERMEYIKRRAMEGKSLIVSALLLSLVLGQIQVEAKKKSCCPTTIARNIYDTCRLVSSSQESCASISGCILQDSPKCVPPNTHDTLENTAGAYEFCKLGCSSSVCGAMITLEESDASEVVMGAVQKCTQACSAICTKASIFN